VQDTSTPKSPASAASPAASTAPLTSTQRLDMSEQGEEAKRNAQHLDPKESGSATKE
jgi:hypothetical protein